MVASQFDRDVKGKKNRAVDRAGSQWFAGNSRDFKWWCSYMGEMGNMIVSKYLQEPNFQKIMFPLHQLVHFTRQGLHNVLQFKIKDGGGDGTGA